MTMTVHPMRAVVLVATSGTTALLLSTQALAQARVPLTLETAVTSAIVGCGAVAALVIAGVTLVALAQGLLGMRPRAALVLPAPLRRFLVASVVVAVAAGVAVPASADEVYPGWAPGIVTSPSPTLPTPTPDPSPSPVVTGAPTPTPDQPVPDEDVVDLHAESSAPALGHDKTARDDKPASDAARAAVHVVVRGDSLWRIAAQALGPEASDADIASAWPLIYQANRSRIGEDPGLILPGQVLSVPQELAP